MIIQSKYRVDLMETIQPTSMHTMMIQGDAEASRILLEVYQGGLPYDLTGSTCVATVIRADYSEVPITGTVSANKMYIDLPQEAYACDGRIIIIMRNVQGQSDVSLFYGIGTVLIGAAGTVINPGGRIPTLVDLMAELDAMADATAAANAAAEKSVRYDTAQSLTDAQKLQARTNIRAADITSLAPAEASTTASAAHLAGSYFMLGGTLYQATEDIASGDTIYTTGDNQNCIAVPDGLGGEIVKLNAASNLNADGELVIDPFDYQQIRCVVTSTNTLKRSSMNYLSRQIPADPAWRYIGATARENHGANVTFVTSALPEVPTANMDMSGYLATGETGRHYIAAGTTERLTIPADTAYIVIAVLTDGNPSDPTSVKVYTKLANIVAGKQDKLSFDAAPTENSTNPVTSGGIYTALADLSDRKMDNTYDVALDWAEIFGYESAPSGWTTGYYNSEGKAGSSSSYIRTYRSKYYTARPEDMWLRFTAPAGYRACIAEYDENGENGTRHGDPNSESTSNVCEITVTPGYRYKFCLGKFDGDAGDYLTTEFLSTLTLAAMRSSYDWQRSQDARLDALESAIESGEEQEALIPAYYTDSGYLQGKLDTITERQNTMSTNQDSFWFITDYHHQYNEGHSLNILEYLAKQTGITKVFFAGDAGGASGQSASAIYHRLQRSSKVWADMSKCTEEFYGTLGNHEWLYAPYATRSGMVGAYLNRYKTKANVTYDPAFNHYIVDNPVNKIRWFFIQGDRDANAPSGTIQWFYERLKEVPEGYSIGVIMHHGYIPSSASYDEYDGVTITYGSTTFPKGISQLLAGCRDHNAETKIGNENNPSTYYDFSMLTGVRHIIGVFCGHKHHGFLYTEGQTTPSVKDIAVFRASTDCLHAGDIAVDDMPWYWQNGVVGGTKVVRQAGTTDEQCFYCVQIDLDAKMLYITAIGGDHDWSGTYEP